MSYNTIGGKSALAVLVGKTIKSVGLTEWDANGDEEHVGELHQVTCTDNTVHLFLSEAVDSERCWATLENVKVKSIIKQGNPVVIETDLNDDYPEGKQYRRGK